MSVLAKVLILGPPDGDQARFVGVLSRVKIRSSARNSSGDGVLPMSFGRVPIDKGLDLQLYSADRENAGQVAQSLGAGLIGAVILVDRKDAADPHYLHLALDELHSASTPVVIVSTAAGAAPQVEALALSPSSQVFSCPSIDREAVKGVLIELFEEAARAIQDVA